MDQQQIRQAYELALALTKRCNEIVMDGYRAASKDVRVKQNHWDVVTVYDQRVEDVLVEGIKAAFPTHRMLAEEAISATGEMPALSQEPTWIIDPIDGTMNFTRGIQFTCISVALVVGGVLEIGIISNPCANELFTAIRGQGAFLNGEAISTRKTEELKYSLVGHEFSIASYVPIRDALFQRGKEFITQCLGLRAFGSAALSLAYLASGKIDVYSIEFLKPWDIAAGALIIMEAGGTVMNIDGGPYNIIKPDIIAAGTSVLAQEILRIIEKVDQDLGRK